MTALASIAIGLLAAASAAAQTPGGPLAAAVRDAQARSTAVWISYRVPIVEGRHHLCFDGVTTAPRDQADLHLALAPVLGLIVFARIESGRVARVRAFTPDCPVEAGSTPIVPVENVRPSESVAWLVSVVASDADADGRHRVVNGALLALSLHADASALPRLIDVARDDPRSRVRGQALFWLAQRAGEKALATIAGAVDDDPDNDVRRRAVFALSLLPKDEGVPTLIEVARTNAHPAVRRQAIFWLGQSNDPRALTFLEDVLKGR